jgi:hypothetical protein
MIPMWKPRPFVCEQCKTTFLSRDARRHFCSLSCAAVAHNTIRHITTEHRKRSSESLRKWWARHPEKRSKQGQESQKGKHKTPTSIMELSKRTISKICRRLNLKCSRCRWGEETGDIHHIIPKKKGGSDAHSNLSYLCPNCHRLADRGKIQPRKLLPLDRMIGDRWKSFYYG